MLLDPTLGVVVMFAGAPAEPPSGFLPCDGRLLKISDNPALYSLIGTTYGGDGKTTFAIPDLRGRTPFGDRSEKRGQAGGFESVALGINQVPTHSHPMNGYAGNADAGSSQGGSYATITLGGSAGQPPAVPKPYGAPTGLVGLDAGMIQPVGQGRPHENMQPFLVLNFYVAVRGNYPARP